MWVAECFLSGDLGGIEASGPARMCLFNGGEDARSRTRSSWQEVLYVLMGASRGLEEWVCAIAAGDGEAGRVDLEGGNVIVCGDRSVS